MSLSSLTKSIDDAVAALPASDSIEPSEKAALIASCDKLKASLESPLDIVFRIMMGTHLHVATRIGVEMGIFNTMAGASESTTAEQLAAKVHADPALVVRIMRVLTGMGFFIEVGQNEYKATPLAGTLVSASPLSDAIVHFGLVGEVLAKAPYYYAENGYKNPSDAYSGPFQYAAGTKLHYFDWLKGQPAQQAAFNSLMQISRANRGEDWFDFYPVEEKLQTNDASKALLVDIGGGIGHDITAFQAKYPKLPGRLVLQDLPVAIADIKELGPGIEAMEYDFFQVQPVKGARAYYLRTVLHDWPDKQAQQILERIHEAMDESSILLINENVLPDANVPLYPAELDMTMMALFASLDRTEKQFGDLLDAAGFRLLKVWKPKAGPIASATLFEAKKK